MVFTNPDSRFTKALELLFGYLRVTRQQIIVCLELSLMLPSNDP